MQFKHKQHERDDVRGQSSTLFQRLMNVPLNVRGLFADTLSDWIEEAKLAHRDISTLLDERVDELNRSFVGTQHNISVLAKGHIDALEAEIREFQKEAAAAHAERAEKENDDDIRRIAQEQRQSGMKYRNIMTHRAGRTGRSPGGVSQKF